MTNFEDFLREQLDNPEVKAEYDMLRPEFDMIQAMINARKSQNLMQKRLSEQSGITQSDIRI